MISGHSFIDVTFGQIFVNSVLSILLYAYNKWKYMGNAAEAKKELSDGPKFDSFGDGIYDNLWSTEPPKFATLALFFGDLVHVSSYYASLRELRTHNSTGWTILNNAWTENSNTDKIKKD